MAVTWLGELPWQMTKYLQMVSYDDVFSFLILNTFCDLLNKSFCFVHSICNLVKIRGKDTLISCIKHAKHRNSLIFCFF